MEMPYVFEIDATTLTDLAFSVKPLPNKGGRRVKNNVKCRSCKNKVDRFSVIKCASCKHFKCAECYASEIQMFGKIACGTVVRPWCGEVPDRSKICEGAINVPQMMCNVDETERIKLRKMAEDQVMREQMMLMADSAEYVPVYKAMDTMSVMERLNPHQRDMMHALKKCLERRADLDDTMNFVCQASDRIDLNPKVMVFDKPEIADRIASQGEKKLIKVFKDSEEWLAEYAQKAYDDGMLSDEFHQDLRHYLAGLCAENFYNKEGMKNKTLYHRAKFLAGDMSLEEFKAKMIFVYERNYASAVKFAIGASATKELFESMVLAKTREEMDTLVDDMVWNVKGMLQMYGLNDGPMMSYFY